METPKSPLPEELGEISQKMSEISTYLSAYVEAQKDRIKLGIKDAMWGLGMLPLLLLFGAGVLLTGIVFFLYGAAVGLGELFDKQAWLGFLSLGGGIILLTILSTGYIILFQKKRSLRRQLKNYEKELAEQRKRFGYDAEERAGQN